ncbi:CHAT domain-containing protein [Mycena galopus ATCC 62051]|nr:CHAT domain-containing protein [Mycena galopus ATCC 62051]
MSTLAHSLLVRFQHLGNLGDLEKSLLLAQDAIHLTPDGHPKKPQRLNFLGNCLFIRFQRLGELDDLERSVLMREESVRLTPHDHHAKPNLLSNLGASLFRRFQRLGNLEDLNKSVLIGEEADHLTAESHLGRGSILGNLANSLACRFEYLGDLDDLNKSVRLGVECVGLTSDSHSDKPLWLNNLGNSLFQRFKRLTALDDLHKSVSILEQTIHLTPDGHPAKPTRLANLGRSLCLRFEHLSNLSDLKKSVLVAEDAVNLLPEGHPDRPPCMDILGSCLFRQFEHSGDLDDLNKSVVMQEDAVTLTPNGHPGKPQRLNNLGNCLITRFDRLGDLADLDKAVLHYSSAACSTTGLAEIRFNAARMWAECTRNDKELPALLEAYQVAIDLLPELAWLSLSITDRHYRLSEAGVVVRDAAAAATFSGHYQKAVEWLEQGRSVIWGQLLNLRTPIDDLKETHPELAKELLSLSAQLDGSGIRTSHSDTNTYGTQESLQSIVNQAHQNSLARERLLRKIRALKGFERFLLPKTISELSQAAQQGPVVVLNISKLFVTNQCDALVLMSSLNDEVIHIPLPNFKLEDARSTTQSLNHLVGRGGRLHGQREGQINGEDEFAHHLSKLWLEVVRPVLDRLAITNPTTTNFPRVWWCLTGPLAFLPIHAAGLYGKDNIFGSKLSDFVISSYTPSMTALIEGHRSHSKSEKALQLLAIAQPSASGQAHIPGTRDELDHIQRLANGKVHVLRLDGHMATVDSVRQGMKDSRWVHFACHGVQNLLHPTESALLLAGSSHITLSDIIQLPLPDADLAFLSACQTATGDKSLQEESVHLAAGMLSAGYRSVIATMWTIMDKDAPQITRDFYEHLFKTLPPDSTQAAEALHLAVQKLREGSDKKSFSHWVPFIHVGI